MIANFSLHEGSQVERPKEVDTTSSSTVIYLRKNIEKISRKDPNSGETVELWQYQEAILTPEEYSNYKIEQNSANIEYIAMMSDIELEA